MPLTHEELGHMAGISRETVTRVFSAFRKENLVQMECNILHLNDMQRLRHHAE
jgi:CRP/FNR family transcriptional regulator